MLRIFTDTNEFFGYGQIDQLLGKREYVLHTFDKDRTSKMHYIRIDFCEYDQLDKLKQGEGRELLYPIYHDGYLLKYFINEDIKTFDRQTVAVTEILQDGRSHYCNYKGEVKDI